MLPLPQKLACPPWHLPTILPQDVDFVIFMQFLVILPKMSLATSGSLMGNLHASSFYKEIIWYKVWILPLSWEDGKSKNTNKRTEKLIKNMS